jgi:UDP-glucuronate 4-epimerase
MAVLVTGAAGFIGFHVCRALLGRGESVVGVDNLDPYYDVGLKRARLAQLAPHPEFAFVAADVADRSAIADLLRPKGEVDRIVHLAAQAGVRHSMSHPDAYLHSNVQGQLVMLEAAALMRGLRHLVYASSSSVYGASARVPFAIDDPVSQPRSIYAVTKRTGELMAETFAHQHGLPLTGLRYFTVYGPWGRPDMAPHIFTNAILAGEPIRLFHHGRARRDLTYVDDVVAGTLAALDRPAAAGSHRLYNLGGADAVPLERIVALFEQAIGRTAQVERVAAPPGDVAETWADVSATERDLGWRPAVPPEQGIPRFVAWYREYYGV